MRMQYLRKPPPNKHPFFPNFRVPLDIRLKNGYNSIVENITHFMYAKENESWIILQQIC